MYITILVKQVIGIYLGFQVSVYRTIGPLVIWTMGIYGAHHFVLQNFEDTLYKYSLVFERPLIYKISISVLLFPYCEGRFSDLITGILVPGFCSINGFGWHRYMCAVKLIFFWYI